MMIRVLDNVVMIRADFKAYDKGDLICLDGFGRIKLARYFSTRPGL